MPDECNDAQMATTAGSRRAGRVLRRLGLCASAVMAATLITGTLTAATAHAATRQITPICQPGYVCLFATDGTIVLIPKGASQEFSNGLPVREITNDTTIGYCLLLGEGNVRFYGAIGAGQNQVYSTPEDVFDVFPGPACPV